MQHASSRHSHAHIHGRERSDERRARLEREWGDRSGLLIEFATNCGSYKRIISAIGWHPEETDDLYLMVEIPGNKMCQLFNVDKISGIKVYTKAETMLYKLEQEDKNARN